MVGQDVFPVAIIGIGCRMPGGVTSPEGFWEVIRDGKDCISEVPPTRWSSDKFHDEDQSKPDKMVTRRAGFIDGIDKYDNTYFRTSPKEAASMDPQQRILMEVSHEAFEDAGIIPDELKESCGVFVGIGFMDYPTQILDVDSSSVNAYTLTGAAHSVAANRISYAFNLRGPSLAVDTACSSSMTAMHLACCALWNNECDLAVLGGANAVILPDTTVGFSALGVLSPDGKCCPFSDSAKGYVRSEGWGAMILKPLDSALVANDHRYATIIGTTVGASGYTQSLTMPSAHAQQIFMEDTYKRFNVDMDDIDYLEAHGTGTPVGDPIEAEAIGMAFGPRRTTPLKIGSVKSNFGHCECSAGAVSTIKAALMIYKGYLVPTINYDNPNPKMDLANWNLEVHTTVDKIPTQHKALIGVNSFGFAGSLAHAILQAAPEQIPKHTPDPLGWSFGNIDKAGKTMIIPLSAKSTTALKDLASYWQTFEAKEDAMEVIGWQATHRKHHECRMTVFAKSGVDFRNTLTEYIEDGSSTGVITGTVYDAKHKICFVFPGQGQQCVKMGKQLYTTEPLFRKTIEACDKIFLKLSGWSLVHDKGLFNGHSIGETTLNDENINDMEISQPAILFLQIGLYELWRHYGLKPDAVVGHSLGEVAAAYASGGLTLEEAVNVIYHRSTNQAMLKGVGSMVAVRLNTDEATEVIKKQGNLYIAAENAPGSLTLAGSTESVHNVANDSQIKAKQLRVQCAFHTPYMDPMEKPFRASMEGAVFTPAGKRSIPMYSTLTGDFKTDYWWQNIRTSVKFHPAVDNLLRDIDPDVFIECAASATLLNSVKQIAKSQGKTDLITVTSGQRDQDDRCSFLNALGNMYTNGIEINWKNVTNNAGQWVDIPKYPWQHGSFWIEGEQRRLKRLGHDDLTYTGVNGNLTLGKFPYLSGYVIRDEIVFPAAGYVEYAIQSTFHKDQKPTVTNIKFVNELIWPEIPEGSNPCVILKMKCVTDGSFVEVTSEEKVLSTCEIGPVTPKLLETFDINTVKSRCAERQSRETFYNKLSILGLRYGPSFQIVDEIMVGDGEVLGCFIAAKDEKQRFQTTLLDGCFQLLQNATVAGTLYLPLEIEKLQMFVPTLPVGQQLLAYAKTVDCNSKMLIGDVTVLTPDGCILAEIFGVKCQNVRDTRSGVDLEKCLYETVWQPSTACMGSTTVLNDVFKDIYQSARYADELAMVRMAEQCTSTMRGIAVAYIKNGLSTVDSSIYKVNPLYIKRLKNICKDKLAMDIPFEMVHTKIKELTDAVPELDQELRMIKNLGDNFTKTLTEPGTAVQILFRPEFLPNYFIDSLSTRLFYKAGADVIDRTVRKALEQKQVVRVLEIGGRMGGLTQYLLEPLKDLGEQRRFEYVFTDLSVTFFIHAQGTLGQYPFVKYQQLDIEKDIVSQGFVPGSIDLVVCLDTIHSLVDIHNGLNNIRELLTDDGMFLMYEATNTCHVAELVFGSLELCWAFEDFRTEMCWLSRDGWTETMTENGFVDVVNETTEEEFFHTMYIGRKPSKTQDQGMEVNKYLLIVDRINSEFEQSIRKNIPGDIVTIEYTELISGKLIYNIVGEPHEVIYVWSDSDACNQTLLSLLKIVDLSPERFTRVVVVTSGSNVSPHNIMGSTAIGIVRNVANTFNTPIFSIDLDPDSPVSTQVQLLTKYITTDDHLEREVAIRNETYLYPRITNLRTTSHASSTGYWQLTQNASADIPSFDDLGMSYVTEMIPSKCEVLIEVKCAALNTEDVTAALELPNENNQFNDRNLGCEVSGIVAILGEDVTSLKLGDEVFGFGKHCLASHAICDADLIVTKPKCLSWEESAGVPISFVSAYHSVVERARLQKGETILIHSGCSDVGLSAIAISKMIGAKILCTETMPKKCQLLTNTLGIKHVSASCNFYSDVMTFTNGVGVDVVLNPFHGDLLINGMQCLASGGRFIDIGKRTKLPTANFQSLLEDKIFISCQLDIMIKSQKPKVHQIFKKVADLFNYQSIKPIPSQVHPIAHCQEVFAMAAEDIHIGKIIFNVSQTAKPQKMNTAFKIFKQSASYLITDAFGSVGLPLSRWLVSKGARHIVMVSNCERIDSDGQRTVEYLSNIGVNVHVYARDLSKSGVLRNILVELEKKNVPEVKGVFHLSGYSVSLSLHNITQRDANKIFESKANIARIIHDETINSVLDHFVILSSIVSTSGHWPEPTFVAANCFVDALAKRRQEDNLSALSIQAGPIRGIMSNSDVEQSLATSGHHTLHVDEFLKTLSELLQSSQVPAVVCLANQDWTATQACSYEGSLKFRHLALGDQVAKTECSLSLEDLEDIVLQKMSKLLCVDPASIDINRPMINYGVDSMMAVEMVTWASKELSVIVSQLDILGGITTKLLLERALDNNVVLPMKLN